MFKVNSELKEHMKTHEQEIFACDVFDIVFQQDSDLSSPIHKIFSCDQCDQRHEQKDDLMKHVQTH